MTLSSRQPSLFKALLVGAVLACGLDFWGGQWSDAPQSAASQDAAQADNARNAHRD